MQLERISSGSRNPKVERTQESETKEALVEQSGSETRKDERKQTEAKYQNQEIMDEKSDRKEWGRRRK